MNPVIKREWGAFLFIVTVLVGAIAVVAAFLITGGRAPAAAPLPPCPSYTPWVSPSATPISSASPTASAVDVLTVNCPTPPLPPTPKPSPTISIPPLPSNVSTPTPAATPASGATLPPQTVQTPEPSPTK